MDITTLRFFNVFGPRQDIHRKSPPLVNYIVRQIKNRETINLFSDGTQLRDYVHVDDVVRMIDICLDGNKSKGGVYNVCSETLTSVHDIIGFAKKAFGQIPEVIFNKPKNFWQNYDSIHQGKNHLLQHVIENEVNKYSLGSCKKAEDVLGWKPNRDIESLMVETMRENYIII
jgi:nucleoside-diphosphate-sugar epimerase